jgi:cytochrome b subunit of formate dehydrogenase
VQWHIATTMIKDHGGRNMIWIVAVAVALLTITGVGATCSPGTGWNSYPPTTSSIQCADGSMVVAIEAFVSYHSNRLLC